MVITPKESTSRFVHLLDVTVGRLVAKHVEVFHPLKVPCSYK